MWRLGRSQGCRAAMAVSSLLNCLHVTLIFILTHGDCFQVGQRLCDSSCAGFPSPDLPYQKGVRYTYRYSTTITTTLHGSNSGRNGLALDCVVDIDVISKCLLIMQIRNPQIKRLSPQKEHSVQRLKSLRESLEKTRLKFSLQGGKVTALCPQEGEQVWTLNVKRALLSMLQTSYTASTWEIVKETDMYGTCNSQYERRGAVLIKMRDLTQCQQHRLSDFWPRSISLSEDTTVDSKLQCAQRFGTLVMEEVNCTETVSMLTWSATAVPLKIQTTSRLILLRAQPGTPSSVDSLGPGVLTGMQFEEEEAAGPGKGRAATPQQASETVRMLCGLTTDQQQVSQQFVRLAFQLRDLSLSELETLWQETSFKCRNDWQPLLDALPACGSENCILLLIELMKNRELEEDQSHSYLTAIALIPYPSPQIIESVNTLLEISEVRNKALLAGSSLIHLLCQRSLSPCVQLPQVQTFIQTLQEILKESCEGEEPTRVTELFYALKSVGNAGLSAVGLIPLLNRCVLGHSTSMELRLAAVQAFRRIPCSADRSVLLQLYRSSQEDAEVRIAAYQQLIRCPDPEVLSLVKETLKNETSSQVGSFVWSHLTNVLRSEDPMKQSLIESLPDDIISRDFEADFWKYSSYSDFTVGSGMGIANQEGSVVFSPKSFLPRSTMANLTVYFHGTAHNLLEVDLRIENAEAALKNLFAQQSNTSDREPASDNDGHVPLRERRKKRKADDDEHREGEEDCSSGTSSYLNQARAMLSWRRRAEDGKPRCWVGVKVFGNELSAFTCNDFYTQINQLSLSMAGLAVRLLKGQEIELNHRAVLMTEELVLPSLSGMPVRMAVNMTSLLSLRLKGNAKYRDATHFFLAGYIKPNAYVGLSARMGVDGVLGQAGVEWASELRSSTSLDGSVQLQEGRDLRITLNSPEDLMDIVSFSSRVFQVSGDHREEIKGPKSRLEKITCTQKTWSKMVGWQLCSNVSYPLPALWNTFPPPGPVYLSLRLLKLDKGLHYYLLEAAYSLHKQWDSWLPREAILHLLLATPQSSISRDMSLDLALNPHRLLVKIIHPLKTIHLQGQLDQEKNSKTAKLELLLDNIHHYYIMGLIDAQTVMSELRMRYYLEAKVATDGRPMILNANFTRGLGGKSSFSATIKNVFRDTASVSVALERRLDDISRQYSVEAELLLPDVVGSRVLGLMEQKSQLWSSALRLKYSLGDDTRNLRQECFTSQSLRSERDPTLTYIMRADHEFYCSNTESINHKIQLRHEESPSHTKSTLNMSYGKHWDEINNKHTLLLSHTFKNQSSQNHTSYTLEFSLQVPEKHLNYRTQLLHSHLREHGSESSTHLKINYNNLMPVVVGLQWKSPPKEAQQKKWEGTFNMDTPWLYIYTTHKLSQPQRHTLQLTSELTTRKWFIIRNLMLEGLYKDRGREKEARLDVYSSAVTYLKANGWGVVGKHGVKSSCSLSSLWSPHLRGDLYLEATKDSHALQMAAMYGKQNLSIAVAFNTIDKNLKKRSLMMRVTLSEPKSPSMEVRLEGAVEELRKDKRMYQKTAMLHLRQPFQNFPQSLLLRETFTVDLLKGLYILESRATFNSNEEVLHTLTLGYQPPSPFICSALIHPFSPKPIPSESELCVTTSSSKTQREVQGRLRIGSKDRLTFYGQVQLEPSHSGLLKVKANLTHLLELQLPSFAMVEGDVTWDPKNNTVFDYLAKGKLRIERQECQFSFQVNGTSDQVGLYSSLSHPFKSKVPKRLEVQATADLFKMTGGGSSCIRVRTDGKDRVLLDAKLSHSLQRGTKNMGLRLNLSQSLLPPTTDLHLNMAANIGSDSVSMNSTYTQGDETMMAQLRGALTNIQGLHLTVSGYLRHSLAHLTALPRALGLDGALDWSDLLTEGQLRVRLMEAVYSVDLRHQGVPGEFLHEDEEGMNGEESRRARNWLCVQLGEQSLCANVSHQLGGQGKGGVYVRLFHSSRVLSATGIPTNNSVQASWALEDGQLSALAKLQVGAENMMAELNGGKTEQRIPRWELLSRLQHQSKALVKRGLPSNIQAKAHYQVEVKGINAGLILHMEEERMVDILLNVGTNNSSANMAVSLWQQMSQLEGVVPNSLQMNCTGDAATDRLLGHCYGSITGNPVEVRAFRSYRPHSRLCYGLAFAHLSFSTQAKGCYSYTGQAELRANLTHSSRLLLSRGLPANYSLRLLLRPGPLRWALGIGLLFGSWRMDLNVGVRLEMAGLYGWYVVMEHGAPGAIHKAEVKGRIRLRTCHVWVDVGGMWASVSFSLLVSARCGRVGRLAWVHIRDINDDAPCKTSLTILGRAEGGGLKVSLGLESDHNSLQCLLTVLLKDHKAEMGWTLQHQWASLGSTIPNTMDLQGSAQLHDTSLSGSAQVSLDTCSAQLDITAAWEHHTSLRVMLQHSLDKLTAAGAQRELTVSMLAEPSQARLEVESDACSGLVRGNVHSGGEGRRTGWSVSVHQRCLLLKTFLPPQFSVNGSLAFLDHSTHFDTHFQAGEREGGSLSLTTDFHPHLILRASIQHNIGRIQTLGFPTYGAVVLDVTDTTNRPGVELGLEMGHCYFKANVGQNKASVIENYQSYAINASHYCPALKETILPVSLVLKGLLSVAPCQSTLSIALRVDNHDLTLDLGQTCSPVRVSGTLNHSFPGLRSRGLPQKNTLEASAPAALGETGVVLIKAGTCHIKAKGIMQGKGRNLWLWAMESECPFLQAHLNGSVLHDPHGIWTVKVDTGLKDERISLRLSARAKPGLRLEGHLSHNVAALRILPRHGRLLITSQTGTQEYVEALLQMGECAVRAIGAVISKPGLQGSVVYHNNCTVIQEWGSPDRIQASGSLIVSQTVLDSQVSMAIGDGELQSMVALRKTKDKNEASVHLNHSVPLLKRLGLPYDVSIKTNSRHQDNGSSHYVLNGHTGKQQFNKEMTVSKTSEAVTLKTIFSHTMNYLKKLGVPENNTFQVEFGSGESKFLTLQSQFGVQQVGLKFKMNCSPRSIELRGTMWHNWPSLLDRGLPHNLEGLCSIQGPVSQLQSKAQLTVDGQKLLTSGLNITRADGRLAVLFSFNPPASPQTGAAHSPDFLLITQFTGPLRSVVVDVRCNDSRLRMVGDVGGWGPHGGPRETKITLKHSMQGQKHPVFQIEAWGRITDSQLRWSMAVNPELSASLALIIQGHYLPDSKELMVKVVQSIPQLSLYLPAQLNARSQYNQSRSSSGGLVELSSGRRRLLALTELAVIEGGYRQSVELNHSFPQLKPLPRTVAMKTVYEARNWSYQVQHGAVWGNMEVSLAGLYSVPPTLEMGNHTLKFQVTSVPRWNSLEVALERSLLGRLDSVLLGWSRHGRVEQVRALNLWSGSKERSETKLELYQPFTATLSHFSLHALTHTSSTEKRNSYQTHFLCENTVPINISLNLNKQWQDNSSMVQACALFSRQIEVPSLKGCVSVSQEGNSYFQNADLRWNNSSVKQALKYQRGPRGTYTLQMHMRAENVSPAPCPSHTLLSKVQTNLKDRLEHTVLLGLCPPQPSLSWLGSHRMNSGEELLFTQTRLAVAGRPFQSSLTLALTNSTSCRGTNISIFTEARIGNWSVEVGGSALSSLQGPAVQVQARLDRNENLWLRGAIESSCFRTIAGYQNGQEVDEDFSVALCLETRQKLTLVLQKRVGRGKPETLGTVSAGKDNQSLILRGRGCSENLFSMEAQVHYLTSKIRNKLLERVKTLQHLLMEFRQQYSNSKLLQELSAVPLHLTQQAEALLGQKDKDLWFLWRDGPLRHVLIDSLPRSLSLLQLTSQLGQQELRRPLATVAGVYHDVTGQRLEALWRVAVSLWTAQLAEALPSLLQNHQLRPLAQASIAALGTVLDVASQQTIHWAETRLATALSGVRKRLAAVYKFSPRDCSVAVSVPLPWVSWPRVTETGVVELVLEEWLLRPMQTLTSLKPTAELYYLKRRIMDSPFIYQALVIADQFVVSFDGHLYELPGSCSVLLAQDVAQEPSFTLLLSSDSHSQRFMVVGMNNNTVVIHQNGQVKANCHVTHTSLNVSGVAIKTSSTRVEVSNHHGVSVSCDLSLNVCSLTLDGWLHGMSTGLLGTNDNDAANDFPLPDGSQARSMVDFFHSWQMRPGCMKSPAATQPCSKTAKGPVNCVYLFSSPGSPLSSCFRVVDPGQFLSVCEISRCRSLSGPTRSPCRLAAAFVHLCRQNYVPLDLPAQCLRA